MTTGLSGNTVFDTGVLLELALGSPESKKLKDDVLNGRVVPVTGELNVSELSYILCRRVGPEDAERSVGFLRRARQFRILPPAIFLQAAARMKCERSLSIVDCVTLAMGEALGAPVVLARHEKEIDFEMKRSPFKTELVFLGER